MHPVSTMTPEEVAAWEKRVWDGTLWERSVPGHGTNARYQRGCFCPECSAAHSNYNKGWYYSKKRSAGRGG